MDDLAFEGTNLIEDSFYVVPRYKNIDFMTGEDNDDYQAGKTDPKTYYQLNLVDLVSNVDGVEDLVAAERLCPTFDANLTGYYSEMSTLYRHKERVDRMFTGTDVMRQCSAGIGSGNATDVRIWDPFNEFYDAQNA